MTYKSKQSKKTALFSKFLQVFKSRATGVAGFHDTLHYHDKFPPFYICAYSGGYPFSISGDIRSVPS